VAITTSWAGNAGGDRGLSGPRLMSSYWTSFLCSYSRWAVVPRRTGIALVIAHKDTPCFCIIMRTRCEPSLPSVRASCSTKADISRLARQAGVGTCRSIEAGVTRPTARRKICALNYAGAKVARAADGGTSGTSTTVSAVRAQDIEV